MLASVVALAVVAVVATAASGLVLLVAIKKSAMAALTGHMIEEVALPTAINTMLIETCVAK